MPVKHFFILFIAFKVIIYMKIVKLLVIQLTLFSVHQEAAFKVESVSSVDNDM